MPKKTNWDFSEFTEAQDGASVEPSEMSRRLICYVVRRLSKTVPAVTQHDVGQALQVVQPMIHNVLYKNKVFARATFNAYAESLGISTDELVYRLLKISSQRSLKKAEASIFAATADTPAATFDLFSAVQKRITDHRKNVSTGNCFDGFDYKHWYGEAIQFFLQAASLLNIKFASVGVIISNGRREEADSVGSAVGVFSGKLSSSVKQPSLFVAKYADAFVRLLAGMNDTHGFQVTPAKSEAAPETGEQTEDAQDAFRKALKSSSFAFLTEPGRDEMPLRIRKQTVFTHEGKYGLDMTVSLIFVAHDDCFANAELLAAVELFSLLVERMSQFDLQDRMTALCLDADIKCSNVFQRSQQEAFEAIAQSLFDRIECADADRDILSMDVWLLTGDNTGYVSPPPYFQRVSEHHRRMPIDAHGRLLALEDAYQQEFVSGALRPSINGKTRHMRAKRCAIAISKQDNPFQASWASYTPIDVGTLLGVPFDLTKPDKEDGTKQNMCFAAIYVRFAKVLQQDELKAHFKTIVKCMLAAGSKPIRIVPRLNSTLVKNDKSIKLEKIPANKEDKGSWYELDVYPTDWQI